MPAACMPKEERVITCSHCKAQVPDGTRFCDQCGRSLATPALDASAGKMSPARPAGPLPGSAVGNGSPSMPRAMPRPPLPPSARPLPEPPARSPAGLKLPSLPSIAQPASAAFVPNDAAGGEDAGGRPATPWMPTAPVPEMSIRPRASLALSELHTPYILPSDREQFLVGREDPVEGIFPDIDLTLSGGIEAGVSRRHAVITYRDGGYWLEDLDSRNYTFLNGIRLEPHRPQPLRDGDQLEFGTLSARFYLG